MATKKQKIAVPDAFTSADEYARVIETTLEAMDPPIDVHADILRLIAKMAGASDEWSVFDSVFKVDGQTITRTTAKDGWWCSAYGAETIATGQRYTWRIRIDACRGFLLIGVSPNRDTTDDCFQRFDSGIYWDIGIVWEENRWKNIDVTATDGDVISIELDANAWTLTFRRNNSEEISSFKNVERGEYCVAVAINTKGDSVSFV